MIALLDDYIIKVDNRTINILPFSKYSWINTRNFNIDISYESDTVIHTVIDYYDLVLDLYILRVMIYKMHRGIKSHGLPLIISVLRKAYIDPQETIDNINQLMLLKKL